jgi:cobalt-zinc-cadmium efflux system membrane fusion protein
MMKFSTIFKNPLLSIVIGLLVVVTLLASFLFLNNTQAAIDGPATIGHTDAAAHADNEPDQAGAPHVEDERHAHQEVHEEKKAAQHAQPHQPAHAEHAIDGQSAKPGAGPHGGQLYLERDFTLEITLEERNGKARYRIWLSKKNTPLPPTSAKVSMRLSRPNGEMQTIGFGADKDSLVSVQTIPEPHMFKASIKVQRSDGNGNDSERFEFLLRSDEGKIVLNDGQIETAGIALANAAPARIGSMTSLAGEITFNRDRTAHVVPTLAGVVKRVSADLGQQVKQGQVLAVIASVQLSQLRSELLSAQQRQKLAQLTFEREKKLWEDKISAQQDYLQAQQNVQEAAIATQNARQKLSALGTGPASSDALSRYELRAPFDGMIIEKHIALGEAVKDDANVFMISDLSTVWAEIIVPAKDLNIVRVGKKATIRATAMDSVSHGEISYVGSLLGEQTRTAKARITLDNPDAAWRPGLFVNVELNSNDSAVAVAVQSAALQTQDGKPTVFIRVDGGFIAQPVVTGKSDGKHIEIIQGMTAGTPYAASGSFVLKAELGKGSAEHVH